MVKEEVSGGGQLWTSVSRGNKINFAGRLRLKDGIEGSKEGGQIGRDGIGKDLVMGNIVHCKCLGIYDGNSREDS